MTNFDYLALDADGRELAGQVSGPDIDSARRELEQRGLSVVRLSPLRNEPLAAAPPPLLRAAEAAELSQELVALTAARQPLAAGFRAAADESISPRVATALRHIAVRLEQGATLEAILADSNAWLPRPVWGIVSAAARTGNLPAALGDLVEHQRACQSLWRKTLDELAYPCIVAILATIILLLLMFEGSHAYEKVFREFQIRLPLLTRMLFWWRDVGIGLMAGVVVAIIVLAMVYRRWRGEAAWMEFVASLPLIGSISYWRGLADWSGLLSVLTKYRVSLPDALRQCADGDRHATLRDLSRELAEGLERGESLSWLLAVDRRVPGVVVPFVSWGEKTGLLGEAFDIVRDIFARRMQARVAMLHAILPPVLFIAIGCFALMVVGGLFMPLWTLLDGLS